MRQIHYLGAGSKMKYSHIIKQRKAFSMIELVFVMIILGIVSSITASLIVTVYESYIIQRTLHNASLKSELAINQLANRLVYRVDKSMLARKPGNTGIVEGTDVYEIRDVPITEVNDFPALEWIAYEHDGFTSSALPGWSGFCDLNATVSDFDSISSTGSAFTTENTILNNLAGGTADNPAIIFMGERTYRSGLFYEAIDMYHTNGSIFPVTLAGTTLTFTGGGDRVSGDMKYTEFYQLLASAYAVIPENQHTINGIDVWDLVLYSNYQPWLGDVYTDGSRSLLAKNISVFRFKQELSSIRIKLCTIEQITETEQISSCKEKAVIR